MGKEKPVNRISPCEADGHKIINTRLCSFCKYERHPSFPCCFQLVNRPSKKQFASRYNSLTFLVADLKLKGKVASFSSCFLARDCH